MSTARIRTVNADNWGIPDKDDHGNVVCRWCRGPVKPPRRTFCGEPCVHEWKIRSSPWYVRREVKKRDKGICRLCGVNVIKARRKWEADHIVPVADGGGECGLENYRLLCRPCHVRVTVEWRANRVSSSDGIIDSPSRSRRAAGSRPPALSGGGPCAPWPAGRRRESLGPAGHQA